MCGGVAQKTKEIRLAPPRRKGARNKTRNTTTPARVFYWDRHFVFRKNGFTNTKPLPTSRRNCVYFHYRRCSGQKNTDQQHTIDSELHERRWPQLPFISTQRYCIGDSRSTKHQWNQRWSICGVQWNVWWRSVSIFRRICRSISPKTDTGAHHRGRTIDTGARRGSCQFDRKNSDDGKRNHWKRQEWIPKDLYIDRVSVVEE